MGLKVFDFHLHLSPITKEGKDVFLKSFSELGNKNSPYSNFYGGNLIVNDSRCFFAEMQRVVENKGFFEKLQRDFSAFTITLLVDFRDPNVIDLINFLNSHGVKMLKFHPYLQCIAEKDFQLILNIVKYVAKLGMFICVDTSYGTSGMYRFDNMKLACVLADEVSCPIILLHSGGLRVLEAMLLAEDKPHVFLETSFSLPYYQGSTIEEDIVFAYKKLGPSRLIYGSDYPYVDFDKSKRIALEYFAKCGFSDEEIQAIMFDNAFNLVGK